MEEILAALAFAAIVTGYVLAIIFIRHEDLDFGSERSVSTDGKK